MRSIVETVLEYIQPADEVDSLAEFEDLIFSDKRKTMIESTFYHNFLQFFEKQSISRIEGAVVNVGIFKGGFSLFLKALYQELELKNEFWLFDSFKGFGEMKVFSDAEKDCLKWFNSYLHKVKLPTKSELAIEFKQFGIEDNLNIVDGFIEQTSVIFPHDKIALLHIDVDFYYPTLEALNVFYDKVSKGGIIIIDDYNLKQTNCKEAVDQFRKEKNISSRLEVLGNYQVAWIKK